jgi:hypothetical protein
MPVQLRNPEMVDLLRPDFQHRYEPNFAWKSAVSALQGIPGLIGCWPMSVLRLDNATDRVRDVAGGGYHLTDTNACLFWHSNLISLVDMDGAADYLVRTAGAASWASVTGTESYVATSQQGLFLGGWFYFDDAGPPAAEEALIGKRTNAAGNHSYWIRRENVAGRIAFHVSNDGTANTVVNSGANIVNNGEWVFIAGRFDNTNNEIKLWVGTDELRTYTAVYNNTIFDGTGDFFIGSYMGAAAFLDGRASMCFLSAMAVNDAVAFSVFQQTRAAFGV